MELLPRSYRWRSRTATVQPANLVVINVSKSLNIEHNGRCLYHAHSF